MYRILIADDEPIERMVLAKKLNQMFADRIAVVQAENGTDAIAFYRNEHCRIAILDINMPGMDGLEAARFLRKEHKDCVLIFLTAYNEFDYARQAITVQALDYLLKPGSDEELETVVEEALRLVKEQDERKQEQEQLKSIRQASGIGEMDRPSGTAGAPEQDPSRTAQGGLADAVKGGGDSVENVRLKVISSEILNYISEHYQTDIALQDISGALGYSEAYFCKIFRQCFSESFTGYLTEYRIEKAKELLKDIHVNIKNISAQVGVRDSNYFARIFKRHVGCTPSEYRNQMLSNQ